MKRKSPLALLSAFIILTLALFVACGSSFAQAGPTVNRLPVKMEFRDDGGHMYMPVLSIKPSHSLRVQDPQPEPQGWSGGFIYRLGGEKEDRTSAGAFKTFTNLTRKGSSTNLTLDGYAGATLKKAVPVAAVVLSLKTRPLDQVSISAHAGAIITQGLPSNLCVGLSAIVSFSTASRSRRAERQVLSALEPMDPKEPKEGS